MPIVHKDSKSAAAASSSSSSTAAGGARASVTHTAGGGASPLFARGEQLPLPGSRVVFGLGWDLLRKGSVDLDASCVCFDEAGQYLNSVYFGNLVNENKSIIHSGDNRDGAGDGDDEMITVQLDALPDAVRSIVFCVSSYNGDHFYCVQSAGVRIMDGSHAKTVAQMPELGRFQLAAEGSHTAMILCAVTRAPTAEGSSASNKKWTFQAIGAPTEGRSFADVLPLMQTELQPIYAPAKIIVNSKPNVIALTKGESVHLIGRDGLSLKHICIGLGWDQSGNNKPIDLDASCVLFDENHTLVEAVFFNNLKSKDGAVSHGGDNRTGAGDGDDEKILIKLDSLPAKVHSAFIVVNSYSGEPFSAVQNAYCRVVNTDTSQELIRFELNRLGRTQTAVLMCKLSLVRSHDMRDEKAAERAPANWMLKALGHGATGSMYKDNLKDMQSELKGTLRINQTDGFKFKPLTEHKSGAAGGGSGSAAGGTSPTTKPVLLYVLLALVLLAMLYSMFKGEDVPQFNGGGGGGGGGRSGGGRGSSRR